MNDPICPADLSVNGFAAFDEQKLRFSVKYNQIYGSTLKSVLDKQEKAAKGRGILEKR
ncbi:hypothetical protein ACFOQM_23165 [Paenibacillus sp. GCM10012307]|uniref:Uncharacterized protein n=1 Tax=Paenibacillus roseus TaxID=2798579 RepID=A0A934J3L7_9BACL|nr:hypothetical protein [Paenibacillus roseus]MBJ6364127.1 hypothetical protein [Paenibacillus roseus]